MVKAQVETMSSCVKGAEAASEEMNTEVTTLGKVVEDTPCKTMDVNGDVEMVERSGNDDLKEGKGATQYSEEPNMESAPDDKNVSGKEDEGKGAIKPNQDKEVASVIKGGDITAGLETIEEKSEAIMSNKRNKKITKKSVHVKGTRKTPRKNKNATNENRGGHSRDKEGEVKEVVDDELNEMKVDENNKKVVKGEEKQESQDSQQNNKVKERGNEVDDLAKDVKEGKDKAKLAKVEEKYEGLMATRGKKKSVKKPVGVKGTQKTLVKNKNAAAENCDGDKSTVKEGDIKKNVDAGEKKEEVKVDKNNKEARNVKVKQENQETKKTKKRKSEVDGSADLQKAERLRKMRKTKAATDNGEGVVSDAGDAGKPSRLVQKESSGLIFLCSRDTMRDCFKYNVLGLPATKMDLVEKVYKGMRLFLFDISHRLMYGIYKASGSRGYNIEPKAFNSAFPAQVRFKVLYDCQPLPEAKFKAAIKENYVGKKRFNIELTGEQVKNLCKLFQSSSIPDKAKKREKDEHTRKETSSPLRKRLERRVVREDWKLREPVRDRQPASLRIRERHTERLSWFPERQREGELISHNGLPRERDPIRGVQGFPSDDAIISRVHGVRREAFPTSGVRGILREDTLLGGLTRRDSGIYDREVNALLLPSLPSYVHEDSLHVVPRHREIPPSYVQENSLRVDFRCREPSSYMQEDLRYPDLHHREPPLTSIRADLRRREPPSTYVHEDSIRADLRRREPPSTYVHEDSIRADLRHREPPPTYVHEDSLRAELRRKELELVMRERRVMDLERRQQEIIHYRDP